MLYPSELQARGCFLTEVANCIHFPAVILSLIGHAR
jgi:hypothetical protein